MCIRDSCTPTLRCDAPAAAKELAAEASAWIPIYCDCPYTVAVSLSKYPVCVSSFMSLSSASHLLLGLLFLASRFLGLALLRPLCLHRLGLADSSVDLAFVLGSNCILHQNLGLGVISSGPYLNNLVRLLISCLLYTSRCV